MPNTENKAKIGGSALIEGIMMTGPEGTGMSLRMPDGSIETQRKEFLRAKDKYKAAKIPFIRGPVNFVDQMIFSYKCIMESAEKTSLDLTEEEENPSKLDKWIIDHFGPKMMSVIGVISAVLGFVIAFFLFIWLPSKFADGIGNIFNSSNDSWKPLVEGIIRAVLLIIYMYVISFMKDIRRMFMYHGAEHKAIACYENDLPLTVENIKKQTRFHPRCGTSFIFLIIIVSIVVSSLVAIIFPGLRATTAVWVLVKILLLPILMGIGYEILQYCGCHDNKFVKIAAAPGLWMQRITTKEPTSDIIEVAIEATKVAIGENKEAFTRIAPENGDDGQPNDHSASFLEDFPEAYFDGLIDFDASEQAEQTEMPENAEEENGEFTVLTEKFSQIDTAEESDIGETIGPDGERIIYPKED